MDANQETLITRFWQDDIGFIISMELILIASIVVIGILMGLVSVRDGMVSEMSDVAGSIQDMNQTYYYRGVTGHSSRTAGSSWLDRRDWCDTAEDSVFADDNCITFTASPSNET